MFDNSIASFFDARFNSYRYKLRKKLDSGTLSSSMRKYRKANATELGRVAMAVNQLEADVKWERQHPQHVKEQHKMERKING